MATPSFAQIKGFANVSKELQAAAVEEFMEYVYDGMDVDEMIAAAANVAAKYANLGCELGAQWYDLCAELAGIDTDPAEYDDADYDDMHMRAEKKMGAAPEGSEPTGTLNQFLQNIIASSIRDTGNANLWRDYERGKAPGKWARVPVGETCAWCLMLASQGAWYLSEDSAIVKEAGHYHSDCNCVAVYFADANDISGYSNLDKYKEMYYNADNARMANQSGKSPYDEELGKRISDAKFKHEQREDRKAQDAASRGEDYKKKPWTIYNEDLIVMRYEYGLS